MAQFAERGLDAVNLGPGATRYAHRRRRAGRDRRARPLLRGAPAVPVGRFHRVQLSPVLAAAGTYPFVRLERAKRRPPAPRGRADRLRHGRPDASRPTRSSGRRSSTRSTERIGLPARGGAAGAARGGRRVVSERRFGVERRPRARDRSRRSARRRRSSRSRSSSSTRRARSASSLVHRAGLPGLRARRAVRGRRAGAGCRCSRRTASCPISTRSTRTCSSATAIFWVNYPNNPTAGVAPLEFFERLAALAHASTTSCSPPTRPTRELWFDEPPAVGARRSATARTSPSSTRSRSARR